MIRIDVLPDDVLLDIFDFCVAGDETEIEAWQSLVHVCRRWRSLVFQSPHRLNLQLCCTPETPTKDALHVWPPALPLIVTGNMALSSGMDNIIAALGQSNRVCQVSLRGLARWELENVLSRMQVPFPELTVLRLNLDVETPSVIPDSFFDGSAPSLRIFHLDGIPFLGMPKLLLSATHLVDLGLSDIPHSGYISPEAIVALLSALSSLKSLSLEFRSPQSRPHWEAVRLPPSKRSVIPALDLFRFKGAIEYLEDLVKFIDAPQLKTLQITLFNQIDFNTPQLARLINCTPTFRALDEAHVQFDDRTASVKLRYWTSDFGFDDLLINISSRESDWQLSSIEQVCNSSLPPSSTVEDLYIEHQYSGVVVWKDDAIENTLWLQLLLPFTEVKNLYISKEFAPGIAAALQELVGDRITEVLPNLQNIFVEGLKPLGPFQEITGQFVATRQLSDNPIAISNWDEDFDMVKDMDEDSDWDEDSDMFKDFDMDENSDTDEDIDWDEEWRIRGNLNRYRDGSSIRKKRGVASVGAFHPRRR